MKSAKNIIDKIFLDFTYKTNGRGKTSATDETRSFFYDNLLPKIDNLLTTRGETADIRIESLTIDLEKISLDDLPYKLLSELEAQLDRHAAPMTVSRRKKASRSPGAGNIDTLIDFLRTGTMPWHLDSAVHPEQLFAVVAKKSKAQLLDRLRQVFSTSPISLERFLLQFTDRQISEVFHSLVASNEYATIVRGWGDYMRLIKQPEQLTAVFTFIVHERTFINHEGFIKAFALEVIIPYLNAGMPLLPEITTELQNLFTAKNGSSIPSTGDKDLPVFFKTLERKYRNKLSTPKNKKTAATIADEELVATKEAKQAESENETTGSEDNSYKADNAGLVLLYPYLQMFFTELKLVKGEAFINKAAQIKAVQVLQYLSAGSLKTPEHLLALNKVICGIDMAMPVSARLRLTKEQKPVCDVLLNSVIANWPPLKITSVEGFRQSFVQRSGSLKKDDKDWILHIERKGIDILLEQLPWSFSIMKLPWNEYLIHVQW